MQVDHPVDVSAIGEGVGAVDSIGEATGEFIVAFSGLRGLDLAQYSFGVFLILGKYLVVIIDCL